jgi:Protein kinase domain/Inner membrane component of T3SS, cytoplasmic domain
MPWQFHVVDGADQGRIFALPELGIYPIGSSKKHAEVVLHDLYVARIHAEVEIEGDRIVITDHDSPGGTLVNGQKVHQQQIKHGDVVRMGNSHLRLENVELAAKEAPPPEEDVPVYDIEVLDEEQAAAAAAAGAKPTEAAPTDGADEVVVVPTEAHALPTSRLKELTGHSLAHFQIEDAIGTGPTSMLFQAQDLKKGQTVALKVLATDFPHSDAEMQRFVQVWKAVLPLRHPNLVPLYGVGKTGPYCWLAMELVECTPLPDVIDRLSGIDRIDWRRGYRVAVQIGRALSFAHEHGIAHGNITARHVLWRTSDKTAKLADLGLATALSGANLKKITLREKLAADLMYFSPEQTEPENFVDGVCDIYGLGVVVFALLTGHYPFVADTQAELIRAIRESKPTRPTQMQPDIPRRLERIVLKMLAKRQEDRYQTAEALLEDLQVVGEEEDAVV